MQQRLRREDSIEENLQNTMASYWNSSGTFLSRSYVDGFSAIDDTMEKFAQ